MQHLKLFLSPKSVDLLHLKLILPAIMSQLGESPQTPLKNLSILGVVLRFTMFML